MSDSELSSGIEDEDAESGAGGRVFAEFCPKESKYFYNSFRVFAH
jgi:hypothetical protein